MAEPKEVIKYISILFLVLLTAHCANQLPPGGGEVDKIPPKIINIYPSDGTTNYTDDYFEVEFSEYVDKRSVKEAIFVSPALEGNISLDWSGKSVTVNFPGQLKENTTYNITIGTDVADFNNQNKMAEAYNFSFSTGDKVDRRTITGRVFSEKPQGVLLFAYLNPEDTLNPSSGKPDYISQAGIDGSYKIPGLAAGNYRIFAVQDEFRDLLFQPEQDVIGVPFKDVVLAEEDTLYKGLDFFIFKIDTVKPRLLTSVMTDKNHLLLSFSEEIAPSSVSSANFSLYDSTAKNQIQPLYAYKNINKPVEVILSFQNNFSEGNLLYVFADSVKDKSGNIYYNEVNSVTVAVRADTINPMIARMPTNQSPDFVNPEFRFSFNDGIDSVKVKNNTTYTDTSGKKINYNIVFEDDASFIITTAEKLEPVKDYIIKFNLSGISDAAGNKKDTVIQYRFKTISGLDFTGLTGRIENIDFVNNPMLILQGLDAKKIIYSKNISANKFSFERVEPGTYRLWAYYDRDSSNTYTGGYHYPFKPSEEFSVYKDSINLRPRWAVTDLIFLFKE